MTRLCLISLSLLLLLTCAPPSRAQDPHATPTPPPFDTATYTQAIALLTAENYAEAIPLLEQVLPAARLGDDPALLYEVLLALGDAHLALNQASEALTAFEEGLQLAQSADDPHRAAPVLHRIATLYEHRSRLNAAASAYSAEASAWEAAEDTAAAFTAHLAASQLYMDTAAYSLAVPHLQAAIPTLHALNRRGSEMDARLNLATAYWYQAQYEEALAALEPALAIAQAMPSAAYEALILSTLGSIHLSAGDAETARDLLLAALTIAEANPTADINPAPMRYQLAWAYHDLDDDEAALATLQTVLEMARALDDLNSAATILRDIGLLHSFHGRYDDALISYQQALDLATTANNRALQHDLHSAIAEALAHQSAAPLVPLP